MFRYIFIFPLLFFYSLSAQAETYGLAMHGTPKYTAEDNHLSYSNPDAPKGGVKTEAYIGTFDTLNPYTIKGQAAKGLSLVYDRLMGRVWDEPFTMYPLIAKSVSMPEDRSSITFTINPDAKHADNTPITVEDVKYSFETLKEYGRPNMRRIYKLVKDVVIEGNKITFAFGDGYDRETPMIIAMMPVLSKSWWEMRDFNQTTLDIPLTNGPYTIAEVDAGRQVTYKRNPDYWAKDLLVNKGHYNFDTITYQYFRDDNVALQAFERGDLNVRYEYDIGRWMSGYNKALVDNGTIIKNEILHQRPERVNGFIFNMRRAPFDNKDVRKALSLVLDEGWIGKNIYYGQQKRIQSYFPNSVLDGSNSLSKQTKGLLERWEDKIPSVVFEKTLTPPSLSPREKLRKASDLLKKAGWVIKDGKRVNRDGKLFHFEIILGVPEQEKIALSYKKSLERLGISADIRVFDAALFQDRLNTYDYDMVLYFWQNSLSPGTEQMLYWSCQAAEQHARWNFSGICNPAVDALSAGIANAKDYADLTAHAQALDRILISENMTIPLFYQGYDMIATRPEIQIPDSTPVYGNVMEAWWFKAKTAE